MRRAGHQCRGIVVAIAVALIAGVAVSPAQAHRYTKGDRNDTPGRLDIRSGSVGHAGNYVVHTLRTYEPWRASLLRADGLIGFGIDKNFDRDFELCAFVYYYRKVRGVLTNCGRSVVSRLPASKLSGTAAKVSIPVSRTGLLYRWMALTIYTGAGACSEGCVDFAPNRPPAILHDLKPPVVQNPATQINLWAAGVEPTFGFPFTVTDSPGAGIQSWTLQSSPFGGDQWTTVESGSSAGSYELIVTVPEGTASLYRLRAVDRHGNVATGRVRPVIAPLDETNLGDIGSFQGGTSTVDPNAWGGTYRLLDVGDSITLTISDPSPDQECVTLYIIGPGDGDWTVSLAAVGGEPGTFILASNVADAPRQILNSAAVCDGDTASIIYTVESGSGFGIDAVAVFPGNG
jgi:hypothetical protein